MTEVEQAPLGVDSTTPTPARLYDYYLGGTNNFLGGTNNFAVDRKIAERLRVSLSELTDAAWANRGFHQRAARWMAEQAIRQFIDLGSGLPTLGNTHEAVSQAAPGGLMARCTSELAPGSYVALSHATADRLPPRAVQATYDIYANATEKIHLRPKADFERLFTGLELVPPFDGADPGVTFVGKWGAEDPSAADSDGSRVLYCGVARRP